jgi:hypothetical protein
MPPGRSGILSPERTCDARREGGSSVGQQEHGSALTNIKAFRIASPRLSVVAVK